LFLDKKLNTYYPYMIPIPEDKRRLFWKQRLYSLLLFIAISMIFSVRAHGFSCDLGGEINPTGNACNLPTGSKLMHEKLKVMCPDKSEAPNRDTKNCRALTVTQHDLAQLIYSKFYINGPLCDVEGSGGTHNLYVSIQHPDDNRDSCKYNDMALFNGELCAAEHFGLGLNAVDSIGCRGVRDSQDSSGRVWRSAFLKLNNSLGDPNTFSPDMDLGFQLYAFVSRDATAFQNWLNWIDANATPCALSIDGSCKVRWLPRFCPTVECTIRPQDIKMIRETAAFLGVSLPHQLASYDNTFNTLVAIAAGSSELLKPIAKVLATGNWIWNNPLCLLVQTPDCVLSFVHDVVMIDPVIDIAATVLPVALVAYNNLSISEIIKYSAEREKPGFPLHLEGVRIFLLRLIQRGDSRLLQDAASTLYSRQKENVFFLYLAKGGPNSDLDDDVLNLFMRECPASHAIDITGKRTEWTWQSEDKEQAWLKNSLWDCNFIAELIYEKKLGNTNRYRNPNAVVPIISNFLLN
jgi:hypothetical protein